MKPSDILIKELQELEIDLSRARRNQGVFLSVKSICDLDIRIQNHRKAISILATHKL